jgi:hypothetical protein
MLRASSLRVSSLGCASVRFASRRIASLSSESLRFFTPLRVASGRFTSLRFESPRFPSLGFACRRVRQVLGVYRRHGDTNREGLEWNHWRSLLSELLLRVPLARAPWVYHLFQFYTSPPHGSVDSLGKRTSVYIAFSRFSTPTLAPQ